MSEKAQAPEALSELGPEENTDKHIVDVLIEERAAGLIARPLLWNLLRPTILPILGYKQTIEAVDPDPEHLKRVVKRIIEGKRNGEDLLAARDKERATLREQAVAMRGGSGQSAAPAGAAAAAVFSIPIRS